MRSLSKLLALALFTVGLAGSALGQDFILRWTFDGDDEVDMSATTSLGPVSGAEVIASSPFNSVGGTSNSVVGWGPAINSYTPLDYFEFSLSVTEPVSYTISEISLYAGSFLNEATSFEVRGAMDNYSTVLGTGLTNGVGPVSFDNLMLGGSTNMPFTFRVYGLGGEAGRFNGFIVDHVTVSGRAGAPAVPEPASFASLLGLALLGWTATRRRR